MRTWLVVLLLPALAACATSGDDSSAGAPDATNGSDGFDGYGPWSDHTTPDVFQGVPDSGPDDTTPPIFDTGVPDTADAPFPIDASDGGCGPTGQPCNTNANNCPGFPFWQCMTAFDGGTNNGVCINVFQFPPPGPCNDGVDQCPANTACLNANQLCLSVADTQCICNNPQDMAACGPPWHPPDAGPSDAGDAAPDAPTDAGAGDASDGGGPG